MSNVTAPALGDSGPVPTGTGHLLLLGAAYSTETLAAYLLQAGWRVSAQARDNTKAATLKAVGITPVAPADIPARLGNDVTHVLVSAPPGPNGDPVLTAYLRGFTAAEGIRWFGYLSTTSVYGDHDGGWVDEDTPPIPGNDRGSRRLAAEVAWRNLGMPTHVFRLAGIYGPGRNAFTQIISGKAKRINKPGHLFNRIHRDDIGAIVLASMAKPSPGAVYNLADDEPAAQADVISFAARLMGKVLPPPIPFDEAELSAMSHEFFAENKRVRNKRVKQDLGLKLLYPSYRSGLEALLHIDGQDG
jgi:nucleoside-diphosphate-sugar epimerase